MKASLLVLYLTVELQVGEVGWCCNVLQLVDSFLKVALVVCWGGDGEVGITIFLAF